MDTFFAESKKFFELPDEVKEKYRKKDAEDNFHGFTHSQDEK
jgi:isopenicillin N synthase-like dioxygenase